MSSSESDTEIRKRFSQVHVLVIGDLMLDRYMWGTVVRMSPEAPVPVVEISEEETRLGGAANVGVNVAALGARASICGITGDDNWADTLLSLLSIHQFDCSLVQRIPGRKTTVKTRVIGNDNHLVRVDREDTEPVSAETEQRITDSILSRMNEFQAIVFEDYDKGAITPGIIREIVRAANEKNIPVIVDPKFRNFLSYASVTLFKPNLKELNEALGRRIPKQEMEMLEGAIQQLREKMPHLNTVVTLGEYGMMFMDESGKAVHLLPRKSKVQDVSGAGDTVVATLAVALAAGLSPGDAARLANLAGGIVVESVGVVPVDCEKLLEEFTA